MPRVDPTGIGLDDLCLTEAASGPPVALATLSGVHVLVLTRHRH